MLDAIFGGLMGISLLWGLVRGTGGEVMAVALAAAGDAVQSVLALAGGLAFFCGWMNVLRRAGVLERLSRMLRPILIFLMGKELPGEAVPYAAMNLAANMLGLGNAATPMGIEAAKRMATGETASNALCLFLVINSSSVQLLPSSVIALRTAAGSRDPGAVVVPALLATGISTLAGIAACRLAEKKA